MQILNICSQSIRRPSNIHAIMAIYLLCNRLQNSLHKNYYKYWLRMWNLTILISVEHNNELFQFSTWQSYSPLRWIIHLMVLHPKLHTGLHTNLKIVFCIRKRLAPRNIVFLYINRRVTESLQRATSMLMAYWWQFWKIDDWL